MFWTAFYVLRGSRGPDGGSNGSRLPGLHAGAPASYMSVQGIRNVGMGMAGALHIPGLSRPGQAALQSHPYYRLLRAYLEHFMPRGSGAGASGSAAMQGSAQQGSAAAASAAAALASRNMGLYGGFGPGAKSGVGGFATPLQGGMGGAGLQYSGASPGTGPGTGGRGGSPYSAAGGGLGSGVNMEASRGMVVLSILVEFWLSDVCEPLPADTDALQRGQDAAGLGGSGNGGAAAMGIAGQSAFGFGVGASPQGAQAGGGGAAGVGGGGAATTASARCVCTFCTSSCA